MTNLKRQLYSRHTLYSLFIFIATLSLFSSGIGNEFITNWDDGQYVLYNQDIQSISLANLRKITTSFYVGNYAPLQMLSYMFDYMLWGPNPTAFFLVNVLLHAINSIFFYRILNRHFDFSPTLALSAALLFAIHPVQVESVAWISQRKNLLSMTFFLAALSWYLSYARQKDNRLVTYLLSCVFFLFALLTKSVVVILPAIMLTFDFTLRTERPPLSKVFVEKIPFVLMAAGASFVVLISQSPETGGGIVPPHGGSLLSTALTMITVYKEYLVNLFWPLHLSAVYHIDIKRAVDPEILESFFLLLMTPSTLLLFLPLERRRAAAFWLTLFFLGFLPVSQIVPIITLMNDRYCYFPLLGISAFVVLLGQELAERRHLPLITFSGFAVVSLLLLTPLTWQRAKVWSTSLSLWQDAASKQPLAEEAWSHLGYAQASSGKRQQAIDSYRTAIQLSPLDPENYANIGILYYNAGDYPAAIQSLQEALRLQPDHRVWLDLSLAYSKSEQHSAAIQTLESKGRQSEPALTLLAINFYHLGQYDKAMSYYRQVKMILRGRSAAKLCGNMALVAVKMGDEDLSNELWQEARAGGVTASEIYLGWARIEVVGNKRSNALSWIERALQTGSINRDELYKDPDFSCLYNKTSPL